LATRAGQILAFDQLETTGGAQLEEGLAIAGAGERVKATHRGPDWFHKLVHRPDGILKKRCDTSPPSPWVGIFRNDRIDDHPKKLYLLEGKGGKKAASGFVI
jgi:hypothetical protein